MKVLLTKAEKLEFFYNALCNSLEYFCSGYGFSINYQDEDYHNAKIKLKDPCFEDVLMQILKDGKSIDFIDEEGDGENSKSITINFIYDNMECTPSHCLIEMKDGHDDAVTGDVIIQSVLFKEIIFG